MLLSPKQTDRGVRSCDQYVKTPGPEVDGEGEGKPMRFTPGKKLFLTNKLQMNESVFVLERV